MSRVAPHHYRGPDTFDRVVGTGALVMLAAIAAALVRGYATWGQVPAVIWLHLATIIVALTLTPVILWRRRGDGRHRALGYAWVVAMALTALDSLAITAIRPGHWSLIHILSAFTLVQLPLLVWNARRGNHLRHRQALRAMVAGALLVAGFFTFFGERLLARWLLG